MLCWVCRLVLVLQPPVPGYGVVWPPSVCPVAGCGGDGVCGVLNLDHDLDPNGLQSLMGYRDHIMLGNLKERHYIYELWVQPCASCTPNAGGRTKFSLICCVKLCSN